MPWCVVRLSCRARGARWPTALPGVTLCDLCFRGESWCAPRSPPPSGGHLAEGPSHSRAPAASTEVTAAPAFQSNFLLCPTPLPSHTYRYCSWRHSGTNLLHTISESWGTFLRNQTSERCLSSCSD